MQQRSSSWWTRWVRAGVRAAVGWGALASGCWHANNNRAVSLLSPPSPLQEAELVSCLQRHPEDVRQRMGAYVLPVYPHSSGGWVLMRYRMCCMLAA